MQKKIYYYINIYNTVLNAHDMKIYVIMVLTINVGPFFYKIGQTFQNLDFAQNL
jgi:hypothetical protein